MKELFSLIRAIVGILIVGYIGAVLWNILVSVTPLRIWYKTTPLTPIYWISGFIFMLVFVGPIIGLIGMGTSHSSFSNGATVPLYIAILAMGFPAYLWGMRQETLNRDGYPNALVPEAPVYTTPDRGKVRTREEAIAHIAAMPPEERRRWEDLARKYQGMI